MNLQDVIVRPLLTEKVTIAKEEGNVVTFAVHPQANKFDIQRAVETFFDVKVLAVRTMQMHRETRRVGRRVGHKAAWKKAMVRLAEGQSIEFFEGV
jgi:large subunit ribosomal protein L23